MLHYVHSSLIYNSLKLERTQISLNRGIDTENVGAFTQWSTTQLLKTMNLGVGDFWDSIGNVIEENT